MPTSRPIRFPRGFTLVEVLSIMVILAILMATVLPQFTAANDQALESALRQELKLLRSQIELYKVQHQGHYPGKGSIDPEVFLDALLQSSDAEGGTGPINTKPYGPYFIGQLPPNPYSGGYLVRIVDDVKTAVPDDDFMIGWLYNPATGQIKANSTGTTVAGTPVERL